MKKYVLVFVLSLLPRLAWSSLELGVGTTSFTSGRIGPALAGAITGNDWAATGFSTGVRNHYYYQSSYHLAYFKTWTSGSFLGGTITNGLGAGGAFTKRGFQDDGSSSEDSSTDFILGPSVRANWSYGNLVYMNLEGTFGVINPLAAIFSLSFQDVICLSIGVHLW